MRSREKYSEHLNEIANDIISRGRIGDIGIYWETPHANDKRGALSVLGVSESLYSGNAGVVLFLFELYRFTAEERFLKYAKKGLEWILDYVEKSPTTSLSFYGGRGGIIYLLTVAYDILHNEDYLVKAKRIVENRVNKLEFANDDMISGVSGALLSLLHLYCRTKDETLLDAICEYITFLIKRSNHHSNGLSWGREGHYIHELCGFAHGACGVALPFIELWNLTKVPAFRWIADQAFSYENSWLQQYDNNWPDFRKAGYDSEDLKNREDALIRGDLTYFEKGGVMNAWCHGASGIGLSRLRAYEVFKSNEYINDIDRALSLLDKVDSHYRSSQTSYTICHGRLGNAYCFLKAAKQLDVESLRIKVDQIVEDCIKSYKINGIHLSGNKYNETDVSLLNGTAGIGIFLIELLSRIETSHILLPTIPNFAVPALTARLREKFSDSQVRELMISSIYPESLSLVSTTNESMVENWLISTQLKPIAVELSAWSEVVNDTIISEKNSILRSQMQATYSLENFIHKKDSSNVSYALLETFWRHVEINSKQLAQSIDNSVLTLNPFVTLLDATESATSPDNILEQPFLIIHKAYNTEAIALEPFPYILLRHFNKSNTKIDMVVEKITQIEELRKSATLSDLVRLVREQVLSAIESGILIHHEDLVLVEKL